jgi:hypothetical protein
MTDYILVMEVYEIKRILFWRKQVWVSTDLRVVEADSEKLAKAIALQTIDTLSKISGRIHKIAYLKSTKKITVEREDYQTESFM